MLALRSSRNARTAPAFFFRNSSFPIRTISSSSNGMPYLASKILRTFACFSASAANGWKHPEIDLSGLERLLHRREWNRRDRHIGIGEPVLFKRGFQPEVARRVKAVDADDLALQIGHRFDRRIFLDVEARAETARAFAGNRRDHLGRHAFDRRENHTVRAAGGE